MSGRQHTRTLARNVQMIKMEMKPTTNQITIVLHGKPVQVEISKYTTCNDVIEMVLYSSSDKKDVCKYGLFESAHGVDKLTAGNSLISKVIRSYGANGDNLSFHVRKIENIKGKLPTFSKAKRKMAKLFTVKSKKVTTNIFGDTTMKNNLECQAASKDKLYQKDVKLTNPADFLEDSKMGKIALMKKYLDDVTSDRYAAVNEPAEHQTEGRHREGTIDLNTAFVEEQDDVEDLNKCFIYDDDSADVDSAFDESMSDSGDEYSNQRVSDHVTKDGSVDKIINILDYVGDRNKSHDKDIESFMKTLIHRSNADDDEGLSSMESETAYSL